MPRNDRTWKVKPKRTNCDDPPERTTKKKKRIPTTKVMLCEYNEALKRAEDINTKAIEDTMKLNNAEEHVQLKMDSDVTVVHLPPADKASHSAIAMVARIENAEKKVEADLASLLRNKAEMAEMAQKIEAERKQMAKERAELNDFKKQNETNTKLNEALQAQARKSQRLIEQYTALQQTLEFRNLDIEQLNNEAKINTARIKELQQKLDEQQSPKVEDPRIAQLSDANTMLKYQHDLLMIELQKRREWFKFCSKSFKTKGSQHALAHLAKIEQEIKRDQAVLSCPDAAEHKAPDVATTVPWTDLESDDESDIDEKAIALINTAARSASPSSPANTATNNDAKEKELLAVLQRRMDELEGRIAEIDAVKNNHKGKGRDTDAAETMRPRYDIHGTDNQRQPEIVARTSESKTKSKSATLTTPPAQTERIKRSATLSAVNPNITGSPLRVRASPPPKATRGDVRRKGKEEESPEQPVIDDILTEKSIRQLTMTRDTEPRSATIHRQGGPRDSAVKSCMVKVRDHGRPRGAHQGRPAKVPKPTYRGIPDAQRKVRDRRNREAEKIRQGMDASWAVGNQKICWDFNTWEGCSKGKKCTYSHRFFRDKLLTKDPKKQKHKYKEHIPYVDIAERYMKDPNCMKDESIFHDNGDKWKAK